MELLLASGNAKKLAELRLALAGIDVRLVTPADVGGLPDVVEDLSTFAGNAAKKARSAALHAGRWSLADDSGLEVDALDGAPGVLSARFAGRQGDDAANNRLLLERLARVPDERRGARFVCALALARPGGEIALAVEGSARGKILHTPRGDGDFGYDPLFEFAEQGFEQTGRTFAELSPEHKAHVSHRGRALRALCDELVPIAAGARARG